MHFPNCLKLAGITFELRKQSNTVITLPGIMVTETAYWNWDLDLHSSVITAAIIKEKTLDLNNTQYEKEH